MNTNKNHVAHYSSKRLAPTCYDGISFTRFCAVIVHPHHKLVDGSTLDCKALSRSW